MNISAPTSLAGSPPPDASAPKAAASLTTKLHRYRFLLAKRWWVLCITLSLSLSFSAWRTNSIPPSYISSSRMMVSGHISLPGSSYSEEVSNFYGTQEELMKSQAVRQAAEARLQALRPELKQCGVTLTASLQQRTSIFILQAVGSEPEYTQAILNAVMQEYINTKKEMRTQKSDSTLKAITDQLQMLEKEIKVSDEALIEFQKKNNINFLVVEDNTAGKHLSSIENDLARLSTEYQFMERITGEQNLERQAANLQRTEAGEDALPTGFTRQTEYSKAKEQIGLLQAKRADFLRDMRPAHPKIIELDNDISVQEELLKILRNQSKGDLERQRAAMKLQIENLKTEREAWAPRALEASGRRAEYETLKAKLDRSKSLYDRLLTSMQTLDVNTKIDQDVVTVLENAGPASTIKPGLAKALTSALILGLGAGIAILFLLDFLDDRLISVNEFETTFSERLLGRIPTEEMPKDAEILNVLQNNDPRQIFAEAFSNLRSSLLYLPYQGGRPKTILVTSAVPNEGKSTVTANLAITLAIGGARTLLVDGDLRRGSAHRMFGVSGECGFSDVLTKGLPWREAVKLTGIENLSLMPVGKNLAQPAKNLLGETVDEFLRQARQEYDFVIFDTCPVLAADDTTTFAPKVDATLFVVRLSFSHSSGSRNALKLLYDRQVNVLGVVLNGLNGSVDGYHYYSEYYYSNNAPLA